MSEITTEDIRALRDEAGQAGDLDQVSLCKAALDGNPEALALCERAIEDARDMNSIAGITMSSPARMDVRKPR